ncbi:cholecystokinin receptor type A-like [Carassius auratus]|uniref:Gastrin/cholecystokinin type B receptor n=1 Tax=Carassius auratus TaxID=7957 RepID=A0A6P6KG18_CARAU|nr:cholecystokinin receptor type A-like [Carassius auratus]XP_052457269.1 cholecystokinin receptor type A-like [Carassius gibelio]
METFTIHDMLINSTDIYKILCGLGIENLSECKNDNNSTSEPKDMKQSVRIALYVLIFLLSFIGNSLIITVLLRNRRMRTVTNLFLLSLAVSDLMLSVFCMPFTLIPNLMKDFIFGAGMCKVATYFMGISVSVSTFNLVAISLERYSAICNPLKSRTWQTKSHATKVITATWVVSFLLMLPYPIGNTLVPFMRSNNSTGHMCRLVWPSDVMQTWYVFLLLTLFLVPGIIMVTAYGLTSLELYRGIKFEMANRKSNREKEYGTSSLKNGDGCYLQPSKRKRPEPMTPGFSNPKCKLRRVCSNSPTANLMAKKRVIRMLLVIVGLFFLCWTPIFVVNAWRAFDRRSADRVLSGAPISFIHLLSYTSACVNPIVYCFMNNRFRQGVLATFSCRKTDFEEVSRSSTRRSARGAGGQRTLCGGTDVTRQADGNTQSSGTRSRLTDTSIRGSAQA